MSLPFNAITPDDLPFKKQQPKIRWTYSQINADEIRPIFDEMIRSNKNMEIMVVKTGYKIDVLQTKCSDALKWLKENGSEEDKQKYSKLRSSIKIGKSDDNTRIVMYFRGNLIAAIGQILQGKNPIEVVKDWVSNAQANDIFDSRQRISDNVKLSEAQREQLTTLCAELGLELEITDNDFRVMKV